jgi:hypothetical protein
MPISGIQPRRSQCLSFGNRGIAKNRKTIMTTPELRTEYMRSSPIAAGRIRRLRVNKRPLPTPLGFSC